MDFGGIPPEKRFEAELEFVQCLASPDYLNWLAQNKYLEDEAFIRFLEYLKYWKDPAYATFVVYPHCLYFLDLLQQPEFRKAIANPQYKDLVHAEQFYSWVHFRSNRLRNEQ